MSMRNIIANRNAANNVTPAQMPVQATGSGHLNQLGSCLNLNSMC